MMEESELRVMVLLNLQGALLGEVFQQLRCVTCKWSSDTIEVRAIVDGKISDEDEESLECIHSEIIALIPEDFKVTFESLRADYPTPLIEKSLSTTVYRRREP